MKKWLLRIGIAVVVIVVAVVVVIFSNLNSIVKKGVETVGPPLTKTEMRLAKASISPFSGSGQLTGLFIGNPEGFKTPSAIKVGDVKVKLNVASVAKDVVEIESINIQSPEITLEGSLSGNNISKILDNLEAAVGGDKNAKAEKSTSPGKKFKVKDIVISGAKVHLSLTMLGGKAMTIPLPELHLQNIGSDSSGVSAAELMRDVIKPLLASVTKAATEAVANVGKEVKDLGKGAINEAGKAAEGIKSLFKK